MKPDMVIHLAPSSVEACYPLEGCLWAGTAAETFSFISRWKSRSACHTASIRACVTLGFCKNVHLCICDFSLKEQTSSGWNSGNRQRRPWNTSASLQQRSSEAMSRRSAVSGSLTSEGSEVKAILAHKAFDFLSVFKGCAREAFQGSPFLDTEFDVCTTLKEILKLNVCTWVLLKNTHTLTQVLMFMCKRKRTPQTPGLPKIQYIHVSTNALIFNVEMNLIFFSATTGPVFIFSFFSFLQKFWHPLYITQYCVKEQTNAVKQIRLHK